MEVPDYWAACERLIGAMPNIMVQYRGELTPEDVPKGFAVNMMSFSFPRGEKTLAM